MKKLSKRQIEVLQLIAEAKNNKKIADLLYIQPRTVECHITQIFVKLDLSSNELHCRVAASNMFNFSKDRLIKEGLII